MCGVTLFITDLFQLVIFTVLQTRKTKDAESDKDVYTTHILSNHNIITVIVLQLHTLAYICHRPNEALLRHYQGVLHFQGNVGHRSGL